MKPFEVSENGDRLVPWTGELTPLQLAPLVARRLDLVFDTHEFGRRATQLAENRLQELAVRHALENCTHFVRQGNTKREILNMAEEENVDLIVIGSHGRSGIQLLLGSTANTVLHGAPCDVLAVRVKD